MRANDKVQPYTGTLFVSIEHLASFMVDAAQGATRGLRREKAGVQEAIDELSASLPVYGPEVGLTQEVLGRIMTSTGRIEELRAARTTLSKMLEVVEETEACLEDEREGDIGLVVRAVRRVGSRDPGLLLHFERTIRYHGQIALRAAQTRRRALEQAKAKADVEAPGTTPSAVTRTPPAATSSPATITPPAATSSPAVATSLRTAASTEAPAPQAG